MDGCVYALHAGTGEPAWTFRARGALATLEDTKKAESGLRKYSFVQTSQTVGQHGTVFAEICGTELGAVALSGETGRVKWQRTDGGPSWGCSALTASRMLVESRRGIRLLSTTTGEVRGEVWLSAEHDPNKSLGGNPSTPVIGPNGTIYLGRMDIHGKGQLFAIDPNTKQIKWKKAGGEAFGVAAVALDETVYVGRGHRTNKDLCMFFALDGRTGDVKWEKQFEPGLFSAPAIAADGTVYVSSSNGSLYALEAISGEIKWRLSLGLIESNSPAIGADGTVYVGSQNHYVYAIR